MQTQTMSIFGNKMGTLPSFAKKRYIIVYDIDSLRSDEIFVKDGPFQ